MYAHNLHVTSFVVFLELFNDFPNLNAHYFNSIEKSLNYRGPYRDTDNNESDRYI